MKMTKLALSALLFSTSSLAGAQAKDAVDAKLLSACKKPIKEFCGDVKNKKDAHEIFDCLDKHEDALKAKAKKCYDAHEDYEKAHGTNEGADGEHHE